MRILCTSIVVILTLSQAVTGQVFRNLDFRQTCDSSETGLCFWDLSWGTEKSIRPYRMDSGKSMPIEGQSEPNVGFVEQSVSPVRIDAKGEATIIARDLIRRLERPRDIHNDVLLGMAKGSDGSVYVCENAGQRIIREYANTTSGMTGPRVMKLGESGEVTELFNYASYRNGEGTVAGLSSDPKSHLWIYVLSGLTLLILFIYGLKKIGCHRQCKIL